MSVVINGDTGISGVNGSAATPAIQGGDADTGIFFGTNNAFIATGGTQRIEVDANGGLGIGNSPGTIPASARLFVNGNDADIVHRSSNSTGTTKLFFNHDDTNYGSVGLENRKLVLRCGASSSPNAHVYVDQNGVFLKGTSTSRTNLVAASQFQVEGTGADTGSISLIRNGSGNAAYLQLASTGGSTIGSLTASPLAAVLGQITFAGSDGTALRGGAYITVENDNASTDSPTAWQSGDCPARLSISTTRRGGNSPSSRLLIDSAGKTLIGVNTDYGFRNNNYAIRNPLSVQSTNNSLDASGLYSFYGLGWYDSFMGGGADNSTTCAVQFEVVSSTSQSYPIMLYCIGHGTNTSTSSPSPTAKWALLKATIYNGQISNVTEADSGGDGLTFTVTQLAQLTYNGITNGACRFKVVLNSARQESALTVWANSRIPIIRTDRLSG